MRLATDRRTDDEERQRTIAWDGTQQRAAAIISWSRNSAYNTRASVRWTPDAEIRVLVERPFPESASWDVVPVGATIERLGRDIDDPLAINYPSETQGAAAHDHQQSAA